jgi:hypothetical protein
VGRQGGEGCCACVRASTLRSTSQTRKKKKKKESEKAKIMREREKAEEKREKGALFGPPVMTPPFLV